MQEIELLKQEDNNYANPFEISPVKERTFSGKKEPDYEIPMEIIGDEEDEMSPEARALQEKRKREKRERELAEKEAERLAEEKYIQGQDAIKGLSEGNEKDKPSEEKNVEIEVEEVVTEDFDNLIEITPVILEEPDNTDEKEDIIDEPGCIGNRKGKIFMILGIVAIIVGVIISFAGFIPSGIVTAIIGMIITGYGYYQWKHTASVSEEADNCRNKI